MDPNILSEISRLKSPLSDPHETKFDSRGPRSTAWDLCLEKGARWQPMSLDTENSIAALREWVFPAGEAFLAIYQKGPAKVQVMTNQFDLERVAGAIWFDTGRLAFDSATSVTPGVSIARSQPSTVPDWKLSTIVATAQKVTTAIPGLPPRGCGVDMGSCRNINAINLR